MLYRLKTQMENIASVVTARVKRFLERMEGHARVRMVLFFVLLVLIGGVMFLLNAHTPLMMDDYDYSFSWATGERINGLTDIFASQAAHYRLWGGRSVVHALAQLFLSMDKMVFNAANTLMYLLLLLEIYVLARPRERRWCWELLLLAHAVLFTCIPFFGTVFLWLTGSCNYLWGTVLALVPLLFAKAAWEDEASACGWRGILAIVLSFFAGWTNENTACGVLGLVLVLLVVRRMNGQKVFAWQWAALAAQAAGVAVMLLAPGNFARASSYESGNIVIELIKRLVTITVYGGVYTGVLLISVLLLWALCSAAGIKRRSGFVLLLLLGALGAAYSMVASPVFSDRSWTGVIVLVLCALLALIGDLVWQRCDADAAKLLALPMAVLLIAYGGYKALGDVKAHEAAWLSQIACVEAAVKEGTQSVAIEGAESASRFTMDIVLAEEATAWPNSTMSKAFGVNVTGM